MTKEETTTLPSESVPAETGSLDSVSNAQVSKQNQEDGQRQVETIEQPTPSPESTRKASEYYAERARYRKRVESLEGTIASMQKTLESLSTKSVEVPKDDLPKYDPDVYWKDPVAFQLKLQKEIEEKLEKKYEDQRKQILEKDFPEHLQKQEIEKEHLRKGQEALELIFPKGDSTKSLTERILENPQKYELIKQICDEDGGRLNKMSEDYPVEAAILVLQKFNEITKKNSNPKPILPTKGQMGSGAGGSIQGGGIKKMNLTDLQAEKDKLHKEISANPDLRYDTNYQSRVKFVKDELVKLAKEIQLKG